MNIILKNRLPAIEKLLQSHFTVSVLGMPGSGISLFLRQLASSDIGIPVYVDVFGLPELSAIGLFGALATALGVKSNDLELADLIQACERQLKLMATAEKRLVVYFAGFDQLQPVMSMEMLQGLQSLGHSRDGKICLIFGLCKSLQKFVPEQFMDAGLRLFGNIYYLNLYQPDELRVLLEQYGPAGWQTMRGLDDSITLSGGHFQLLLLLLSNERELSDAQTDTTALLFKNIYNQLTGTQRTILRKIASNSKRTQPDEYLLGIGMVQETEPGYRLFSPLFDRYISGLSNKRLPAKERRLFLLLKKHIDQVVPKQQIIDTVWGDEIISDWALNALVYRLRKHSTFLAKDLVIENHKKIGYELRKNT